MSRKPPRAPLARHGRLRSPRAITQVVAIAATVLVVGLLGLAGTAAFALWSTTSTITDNAVALDPDRWVAA